MPPRPLTQRLGYAAYDALGALLAAAAMPVLPLLALTHAGRHLGERLGRLPAPLRALRRPLWVHAASVGEVLAAEPLVAALRRARPDLPVLISTTSVSGRETARTRLRADAVMLLPVDVGWIVGRAVRRLRPRCLVVVETEIWPALLRAAARRGVPCVMVSGRISPRAAARYAWIRWLTRAALAHVDAFAMQSEADAARLIALGAPPQRVQVVGNLKLARGALPQRAALKTDLRQWTDGRPVLVAASTHAGEEELVLDACRALWPEFPTLLLVIAPRRPERFDAVAQLLARAGLRAARRSRAHGAFEAGTQVLLLDTLGELPEVLPGAWAVFVGGTVAPRGGHNVWEPALFGKPVAFGPHTANVAGAAQALLAAAAGTLVHDAGELGAEWRRLLAAPAAAAEMGARGRAIVAAGAAVAARTAELVCRCCAEPAPLAAVAGDRTAGHA